MDIKVYNSVKSVKVSKVYISDYSSPSIFEYTFSGDSKFWDAVRQVNTLMENEVLKMEFTTEYSSMSVNIRDLMSFWAYELMTHTVARIDSKFHQHSSGFKKDEHIVNGAKEPVERLGIDVRSAVNDGLRHYNLEQAEAAEQASAEFWKKVEEMKEGNQ